MKIILQTLILTLTLSIVACNKSATSVESNPTKGTEYKQKQVLDKPLTDEGTPSACPNSYTFAITTQDGQPVDQDNLPLTVRQLTTYRITVTSSTPNFKLKAVSSASNINLVETKTAGLWNLSMKPTESQGNQEIRLAIVLPVPKDEVCVDGVARETLTLNIGFGKPRPAVNVLDFDQNKLYPNTTSQAFQVEVNDPNIKDNETPKAPVLDFRALFDVKETLFLSAQNAVTCAANGSKVADKTFRFSCSIDFNKISMTAGETFGHSDFLIYGVSVNGDKSIGESIAMTIQYPPSEKPAVKTEAPKKEDKKANKDKKASPKDSSNKDKKASSKDSKKTPGVKQ